MQIERPVRKKIHVHRLSVAGLKMKSPLTLRVLPFSPTLSNVKKQKDSQASGERRAAVWKQSRSWVPVAGALPPPGARVPSGFLYSPARVGILLSGQAEGSFSELRLGLARWKCRPKLGIGEDKMGPRKILGFWHGIGRLGPRQRAEWPGFADRGGWNTQNSSCRAVQTRMSQPPALISFQSPVRSQVGISSLETREDRTRRKGWLPKSQQPLEQKATSPPGLQ